ncbi:major facilitator superfamily domain-containing protein [Circinella umbellata]|nr:major facilitator superfamily domain-containing protein [Circinella umbellata]
MSSHNNNKQQDDTTVPDMNHHLTNSQETKSIYTPEEKKLVRKINFITVPFICFIAFLQMIDKSTLNFSAVMGIFQDTGISGNQFAWLGSIYYLGYLIFQIPNQYLLQKIPIAKYLGTALILWGLTVGCTALATNFIQLCILRFLLGLFESVTYPALYLLIAILWRRTEQVMFFSTIPISNALGGAFAGLISLGFLKLDGLSGLSSWKWCMIILGSITIITGIFTFLFLPDKAKSKWYRLSLEETLIVQERIRDNSVIQTKEIKNEQIIESLKEPRFYCYILITFFINLTNGCLTTFSTIIIKNMGFSDTVSILLNIPTNFIPMLIVIITVYFSRYQSKQNTCIGAILCFITLMALIFLTVLPLNASMLLGMFFVSIAPIMMILYALISNNITGYTKRVFYNGSSIVAYCMGNFIGPLFIRQEEAPRYRSGLIIYIITMFISILLFFYIRWTLIRDNTYRQQLKMENKLPPPIENRDEMDVTDRHDLHFMYRP